MSKLVAALFASLSVFLVIPAAPVAAVSPPGCPATEEADVYAKGRVIAAPGWVHQWFHPERAWQFGVGAGVTVAIVDTGINQHRQLGGSVYAGPGHDFVRNSGDGRLDCTGRGTALASIVAAQPAAGSGVVGFAHRAKLLAVRVSERSWGFTPHAGDRDVTSERLANGVRWAADNGAHVINVSLALSYDAQDLRDAVAYAVGKGAIVVAAVGKEHFYPAAYPGVIGVGALTADGQRADAARAHVDLYAPGVAIDVAARDSDHFTWLGGADAASAVVSAAAALVKSASPGLTGEQVRTRLLSTASGGLVDPFRAMTELHPTAIPSASPSRQPAITANAPAHSPLPPQALTLAGTLIALTILILYAVRLTPNRQPPTA